LSIDYIERVDSRCSGQVRFERTLECNEEIEQQTATARFEVIGVGKMPVLPGIRFPASSR